MLVEPKFSAQKPNGNGDGYGYGYGYGYGNGSGEGYGYGDGYGDGDGKLPLVRSANSDFETTIYLARCRPLLETTIHT